MGSDDLRRLREIRNDKLHRLRLLEKRQSIEGFNTPPEVVIEIEQTRRELGIVENALTNPGQMETAAAIGPEGQFLALDRKLDMVVKFVSDRMDAMEQNSTEWRETERAARIEGQRQYQPWAIGALALAAFAAVVAVTTMVVVLIKVL